MIRRDRRSASPRSRDQGSATLEFALVAPLVAFVALLVVQLALALHVRTTLTAAAAEGARVAALHGSDRAAGMRRTHEVLSDNVAAEVVDEVRASYGRRNGLPVATVSITARLPVIGLAGPTSMTIDASAVREP